MEVNRSHLHWFHRPPRFLNRAINPGLRNGSRLYTQPTPMMRPKDSYPDAQLKIARNKDESDPELLITLNDVKNLFVRQLPNMGSSYITRFVFDLGAESVIVLHEGRPMGAISSRIFEAQQLVEIVFCAVDSSYQAQGYGRLVMSFLKTVIQAHEILDILTCADNDAVIYFKKQGFNDKEILVPPERWVGFIKDYDGVTLVHSKVHPEIDYINYQATLTRQLNHYCKKTGFNVHGPLPEFGPIDKHLPHAPTNLSVNLSHILKTVCPNAKSVNILEMQANYDEKMEILKDKLSRILNTLKTDKNAEIFLRPVTEDIASDYYDTIQIPMDLQTIEHRLRRYKDYYKAPELFESDIEQMIENAKKFNNPDSPFFRNAIELLKKFRVAYQKEFPELPNIE